MPPDDPTRPADERTVQLGADAASADSVFRHLKAAADAAPPAAPGPLPTVPGYEIVGELGRGGMGVVYEAKQVGLNRVVALKMILAFEHAAESEIARFLAEAEAVAAVKHANVVQVHALGTAPGPHGRAQPYFAMEYVSGGSLARYLAAHGPLAPLAAADLIAAVADGVQAAHDAGIVHRDLKPGNVLLASGGRQPPDADAAASPSEASGGLRPPLALVPKVTDFGLAKRLAVDVTRSVAVVGTPAYMSPEQADARAKFVGPAADVYALGVILFECLTGRPPFEGEEQWAVVRQVLEDAPPSPRALAPAVPRDLELICLKCLEKEAHHRYPTAAALAADLRRFVADEPVSVRPIRTLARVARWAKRRPAAAALVALVALLLVTLPPVAVWAVGRMDRHITDTKAAREREEAAVEAARLAEDARIAALKLADARELFALQNKFRTRAADRPLGWAFATGDELPRAVALAADDPDARLELRSTAAVARLNADLRPLAPAAKGFTASAAATDPRTGRVAVGEKMMRLNGRVLVVDPASGDVTRELTFTAGFVPDPFGAPDAVRALAFSPDGTRLFVGTRSSLVMRYDLDDPRSEPAAVWKAFSSPLEQLAVSPDGKTVYGRCRSELPVFAWSADGGKLVTKLDPSAEAGFTSFAVLPGGDVLACEAHQLRHWTAKHTLARAVPNPGARQLSSAPGGTLLVGDGRNLDVYCGTALARLDRFTDPHGRQGVHDEYVKTVAVHPGGAFAASAALDADRAVKVWELASGRLVSTVTVAGTGPVAVAWSGDGRTLVATADGHLARWRFRGADAQRFACLGAHPADAAAFTHDGQVAALAEADGMTRALVVGAPGGMSLPVRLPERGGNGRAGVACCPNGTLAVSAGGPGLFALPPGGAVPPAGFVSDITWCPRFSPDGKTLWAVTGSSTVTAFDPADKKPRAKWSNALENATRGLASLDALAVGRGAVVAAGRSGTVQLLDAKAQFVESFPASGDPVLALALSPDEALVVAGTQSGQLRTIRLADRRELPGVAAHPGGVTAAAFSRDGALLATGGRDRVVRLWKRTGDRFEPVLAVSDLAAPVRDLQFGAADQLLVLLSRERAARVWDVPALKAQLTDAGLGW